MTERAGGRIDPSISPRTQREREIVAAVRRRGLTLVRCRPGLPAVRVIGPGVDLTVAELRYIERSELRPPGCV